MPRATSSLPTPLSPRISTVALLEAARAISSATLLHDRAAADDLALHAQPLAELHVLGADLGQVLASSWRRLRFSRATATVSATARVNSRSSGSGARAGVGRVEMDQAEDLGAAADRGADHADGEDLAVAVAAAQGAVAHDVSGQHGFAFPHHRRGQDRRRPAGNDGRRRCAEATTSRASARGSPCIGVGQQEHRAGVGVRAFEPGRPGPARPWLAMSGALASSKARRQSWPRRGRSSRRRLFLVLAPARGIGSAPGGA